jgi:transketolase
VLAQWGKKAKPDIILMASGSEVALIVEAGRKLAKDGVTVRLVSFPSWELFAAQSKSYREKVLPPEVKARLSVEAGVAQGWQQWASAHVSLERFGASAPGEEAMHKLGFSVANVLKRARALLPKTKKR